MCGARGPIRLLCNDCKIVMSVLFILPAIAQILFTDYLTVSLSLWQHPERPLLWLILSSQQEIFLYFAIDTRSCTADPYCLPWYTYNLAPSSRQQHGVITLILRIALSFCVYSEHLTGLNNHQTSYTQRDATANQSRTNLPPPTCLVLSAWRLLPHCYMLKILVTKIALEVKIHS